jgi:hypothetical protein
MSNPNYSLQGWVARAIQKIGLQNDGGPSDPRGPRFNQWDEQQVAVGLGGEMQFADEGTLCVATMTPSQTALQLGISAAFSGASAALVIHNNAPAGSGIRCMLREIHFLIATAPASGTGLLYATEIDSNNRAPTTVSGTGSPGTPATATAYLPLVNTPNFSNAPVSLLPSVWFPLSTSAGAPPVVPAPSSSQIVLVGNGNLRSVIPVGAATSGVQDDYRLVFGATDKATGGTLRSTAAATQVIEPHPAVSLDPQAFFLLHLWAPGNAATGMAFAGLDVSMVLR